MIARPSLLALLLLVGLASDASAQTFGGGRFPPISAKPRGYVPTVGISLQPRGSQIAVRFDTTLRCGKDLFDTVGRKVVAFDGASFRASGASIQNVARGRLAFSWTLAGTVSGATASGKLQITGVRRVSGRNRSCRQRPTRGFQAVVAGAPAGPATRPGPRALYLGTSSYEIADGLQAPVLIRATNKGGQLSALWPIAGRCARGPRVLFINQTPLTRVRADGTFARSERFSVRYADALIRYRARFTGRFLGQGATGTLRLRARIFSRNGKTLRTRCDSGVRTWNTALAP